MMKRCFHISKILLLGFTALPLHAEGTVMLRDCISSRIVLENVEFEDSDYSNWQLYADVTNNSDWPISGIRVEFKVLSPERLVPWLVEDATQSISGGVEPQETRQRIFLTSRPVPGDTPDDAIVEVVTVDVADADGNQLVNDVTVIGGNWTNERTELECIQ